jgi:hypothetical protein
MLKDVESQVGLPAADPHTLRQMVRRLIDDEQFYKSESQRVHREAEKIGLTGDRFPVFRLEDLVVELLGTLSSEPQQQARHLEGGQPA